MLINLREINVDAYKRLSVRDIDRWFDYLNYLKGRIPHDHLNLRRLVFGACNIIHPKLS
jgi:hypothetical protein